MRASQKQWLAKFLVGTSALSLMGMAQAAGAQEAPAEGEVNGDEIVVTGIRASLEASAAIKREAQGVVDAISAEDIGKFPDTNLAESLQRITGVSIDRQNGEGSLVTVRGFGPEFNLVTVNGRQVPTAVIGDGGSAPSSRSFDFANLASEGIAAVEVYKSGRATIESGGIGSSINIRTPRPLDNPGMRGSLSVKGVYDTSRNSGDTITPEVSGIFSTTFADDTIGIMVAGSYQKRKSSTNTANVGWRDGYLGNENNWGSLANPTRIVNGVEEPDPRYQNIINRPEAGDVYQVPQNASYDLNDINRERINGQAVLQFRPSDAFTATVDYIYSRNTVETRNSNVGVWFNHDDTSSAWTDGPVAGPLFYSERFGAPSGVPGPNALYGGKDLSYSGALIENRAENNSLGVNLEWKGPGGVTFELDGHHSTAEVNPVNRFGSSMSLGNAVFGVQTQTINFENDLPIISYGMYPGIDPLNASLITPTGNAFRNAYFRNRINQLQLRGQYDHDGGFLDSIDFGVSYVDSKVRSAFGTIQNDDTWGGAGPASSIPDDIFTLVTLPDKFPGLAQDGMIQSFYSFDFERMADLVEQNFQTCSNPATGSAQPGTCLANFNTDRRITEKTLAPYLQVATVFDLFENPAHLVAGIRYETTDIASAALVPVPVTTTWVGDNEFNVVFSGESDFTRFKGSYDNWLPAVDFDISPMEDIKLRASYSHTITRPDYASMQGGRTIDTLFRVGGGTGAQGNPGLVPYKSKNIDLSAEWYYAPDSYLSVGYFHKDVKNFISSTRIDSNAFGLTTPVGGPRWNAAIAAIGSSATASQIRQYIFQNFPQTTTITGGGGGQPFTGIINAAPGDPLVNFEIATPINSDQKASINGWEFAVQHSFWDTGFGVILNYTIVNGDATYDNTQPSSVPQFALTGLSDSANAVAFYDKNGLQARVAWNWRDEFLAGTGPNPFYTEEYWQIDASASYEFIPGFTAFVEAINLTGEGRRGHLRHKNNVTFVQPGFARYAAGVRFSF
ncbi:TonB-dependent receptor [Sphingopyxis sp. OAS728]|uniref:TonB-dependent receptor n=1 Tax=Sphingopyxis sp. OAS728 TaxID=2663823 RepID=UPI00178BC302|nr:TonB-dependent receptor [Sphingopyxis sp. OAS728]MBE1525561.1 TonB-dependent receptor [Sphingopyxis sp. OAS728]